MNRQMERPGGQDRGGGRETRFSRFSLDHLWPPVNSCDLDFPVAGPDPLMAIFFADVADLGDAFREHILPAPPTPTPAKRLVGVEL